MSTVKTQLNEFLKNIYTDNFSDAEKNLKGAIIGKLQNNMRALVNEKKVDIDSEDDETFEKIKGKTGKPFKKGSKTNKPQRGGKRE